MENNNMKNSNMQNNMTNATPDNVQNVAPQRQEIIAVQRDQKQRITAVKLQDGSVHDIDEAISLAMQGHIANVIIGHSVFGDPYLRDVGDGVLENNLKNLPEF